MHDNQRILSSKFNMSLGYIPVLISIFLEPKGQGVAIFSGLSAGVLFMALNLGKRAKGVPNLILNLTTCMLAFVGMAYLIPGDFIPKGDLPFTLELSIVLATLPFFLHRRRFISYLLQQKEKQPYQKRLLAQSAESAIVSVRIFLIIACLHLTGIALVMLAGHPVSEQVQWLLFTLIPPAVFILTIVLNQIGINYFNHLMKATRYLPVVDQQGAVIGRKSLNETDNRFSDAILPIIRIAIASHGTLYLCQKEDTALAEGNSIDLPLETYLYYGETLEEGCERLLESRFEQSEKLQPIFSIRYYLENKQDKRLVYLYLLDMDNGTLLSGEQFKGGKFWRFEQIEANLGCQYFSPYFEEEYEHLKDIIDIREKYKGF